MLHFNCDIDKCIAISRVCDLIKDCEDGKDERECPDTNYDIPLLLPKQSTECLQLESDIFYQKISNLLEANKFETGNRSMKDTSFEEYICPLESVDCYPWRYVCTFDKDFYGNELPCENTWHLEICNNWIEDMGCMDKYECDRSCLCIPLRLVCNGVQDCPGGDDENDCEFWTCPRMLRCTKENIYVYTSEICDGILHCPFSGDDESICSQSDCPSGCKCLGRAIWCFLSMPFYDDYFTLIVLRLDLTLIGHYKSIFQKAWYVDLSHCNIENVAKLKDFTIPNVVKLKLNHNPLVDFSSTLLMMKNLKYLEMQSTSMIFIRREVFQNFPKLVSLNLANSNLQIIERCSFCKLTLLKKLDLSNTLITHVTSDAFTGLHSLSIIISNASNIKSISKDLLDYVMLKGLNSPASLKFCCVPGSGEIVPFCRDVGFRVLMSTCPNSFPQDGHHMIPIALVFLAILQSVAFLHILFSKKKYPTYFCLQTALGLLLLVVMLAIHFYNQHENSSSVIYFENDQLLFCQAIGLTIYICHFWYKMCNILHFLTMYLKVKHALDRSKQFQTWHCVLIVLVGVAINCGVGFSFKQGKMVNSICLIEFTKIGNILMTIISGLFAFCIIALALLSLHQIIKTRKKSKRVKLASDKQLEARLCMYAFVSAAAFVMEMIYQLDIARNTTTYICLFYSHLSIMPISFTIIFLFSTRTFRNSLTFK